MSKTIPLQLRVPGETLTNLTAAAQRLNLPKSGVAMLSIELGLPLVETALTLAGRELAAVRSAKSRGPFFGIDVETGGFEAGKHALLAIGCWWSNGEGVQRYLRLRVQRQPRTVVEPGAARANGWQSDEQWRDLGAVPLKVAVWALLEYVERLQRLTGGEKLVAVAHNAAVDWSFIEYALVDCGGGTYPLERWHDHVSHHVRCSLKLFRSVMDAGLIPEGSASLDRLIELSRQNPRAVIHDPRDDARYALNGYEWLLAELNNQGARRLQPAA